MIRLTRFSVLGLIVVVSTVCIIFIRSDSLNSNVDQTPGIKNTQTVRNLACCEKSIVPRKNLFIVSTLDGHLTAFDIDLKRNVAWSLKSDSNPLFSSNIGNLQFATEAANFHLIPSLDGSFYMYDDSMVRGVPVTADMLLSSSMKLGSDIISGGKDVMTMGIDAESGHIQYSYALNNRMHKTATDSNQKPANMIIRRTTRVLRAVEAMSGSERWNVSVAELELMLPLSSESHSAGCFCFPEENKKLFDETAQNIDPKSPNFIDIEFRMIPADGFIAAYLKSDSLKPVWTHKLETPVVQAWRLDSQGLNEVSLFDPNVVPYLSMADFSRNDALKMQQVLYIGTYNNEKYVIPSPEERIKLKMLDSHGQSLAPYEPSRLYLAANSFDLDLQKPVVLDENADSKNGQCFESCPTCSSNEVNSMILKDRYPKDMGWYLFKHNDQQTTKRLTYDKNSATPKPKRSKRETMRYVFWTWWNIFLFVGIPVSASSIVIWHLLKRQYISDALAMNNTIYNHEPSPVRHVDSQVNEAELSGEKLNDSNPGTPNYESWYLKNFEPVRCLGRGGFGIVLESLNKFDQQVYAVKRIAISNKPDGKERVQREVMALAKLDHPGVVRYYNSWLEEPPIGWQENWDKDFVNNCSSTMSQQSSLINNSHMQTFSIGGESNVPKKLNIYLACSNDIVTTSQTDSKRNLLIENTNSLKLPKNDINESDDDSLEIVFANGDNNDPQEASCSKNDQEDVHTADKCLQTSKPSSCPSANTEDAKSLWETKKIGNRQKAFLYIQMQLCKDYTLRDMLRKRSSETYSRSQAMDWFDQIVFAVQYVHDCGLIHRDLKPSNIFFAQNGQLKIGDFGLAKGFTSDQQESVNINSDTSMIRSISHTDNVGTWLYMSPEQENGGAYTFKVDIYALGLIFVELLLIFTTEMERRKVLSDLKLKEIKFPEKFRESYGNEAEIIGNLLEHDPDQRWTCDQIRKSAFFAEFWSSRPLKT